MAMNVITFDFIYINQSFSAYLKICQIEVDIKFIAHFVAQFKFKHYAKSLMKEMQSLKRIGNKNFWKKKVTLLKEDTLTNLTAYFSHEMY